MPKLVTWNNETNDLATWARKYELHPKTVQQRYNRGIRPPELFEPVKK